MTERIRLLADKAKKAGRFSPELSDLQKVLEREQARGADFFTALRIAYAENVPMDGQDLLAGVPFPLDFADPNGTAYPQLSEFLERDQEHYGTRMIPCGNHKCADYAAVMQQGMEGVRRRIREARCRFAAEPEKLRFLEDLEYAARVICAFAEGHADAAEKAARGAEGTRKEELLRLAEICRRVPSRPAQSFYEAVQSFFFCYLAFPDGLGPLDRYLFPYYKADMEAGRITREEALELIENLLIDIFSVIGPGHTWSGFTHGVLAGYDEDKGCAHNECTSLILQAVTELPLWRPQFSYRVTAKTGPEQLREAVEAHCKRPDLMLFLNDDVLIPNLLRLGVAYRDAIFYSVSGCNELILTGCSQMGALEGHINVANALTRLLGNTELLASLHSFEDFYAAYERELQSDVAFLVEHSHARDIFTAQDPMLTLSLLTRGCVERATAVTRGGADYNFCTWCLSGLINIADSLAVLRQTVFEQRLYTLSDWADCLRDNWQGHEEMEKAALGCTHFGNADAAVDGLVNRVAASVNRLSEGQVPYRGGKYLYGTLTGYEIAHVVLGKTTSATPDGRYFGAPFAASIAAFPGSEHRGIGAYLASAARVDGAVLPSSVVVNLALDKSMISTPEKRDRLAALLRAYFDMGGVQLQINYLSADELVKAQCNPEDYRDLRVRVTGFSGFFTTFDKDLQDEIIHRTLLGQ